MSTKTQKKLLEVKGLKKYFHIRNNFFQQKKEFVKAVDDLDLHIYPRETLGLVGESGCGKTTAARSIIKLLQPTAGDIFFRTNSICDKEEVVNLASLNRKEMKPVRRNISMIFQDPMNSLNPRMSVYDIITEPIKIQKMSKQLNKEYIAELLEKVGLRADHMHRYPHEFSGGQRQRIGLARAICLNPSLILCDEPVSALDVSIQAQTLNLLQDLQEELNLAYLFVAHDLSVVQHISHRIAVMYVGRIVESGSSEEIFRNPLHPYTEVLMDAVPRPDPDVIKKEKKLVKGDIPDPSSPPSGCYFHSRCRYAQSICKTEYPETKSFSNDRFSACHFAGELGLSGV